MKFKTLMILGLLLTLCTACGRDASNQHAELPLQDVAIQNTAEMPEDYPEELSVYSLDWYIPDEEHVTKALMKNGPGERFEDVEPYYSNDNELLRLHIHDVHGGLTYINNSVDEDQYYSIELLSKEERPDYTKQERGNDQMRDFKKEGSLAFADRDTVLREIEGVMEFVQFPELMIQSVRMVDMDTLNANKEIYNRTIEEEAQFIQQMEDSGLASSQVEEPISYVYSEKDEQYRITYRQVLNGIPFFDRSWSIAGSSPCFTPAVSAAYQNGYGLYRLDAVCLCEVRDEVAEVSVIPPEEAVENALKEKTYDLEGREKTLYSIELCYVIIQDGDTLYAKPAWILSFRQKEDVSDPDIAFWKTHDAYYDVAVSAETGKVLRNSEDTQ